MRLSNISDITPGDIIITSNNQYNTPTYETPWIAPTSHTLPLGATVPTR